MDTLRLRIRNPVCSGWEHEVKRALRDLDGVQGITASYKADLIGITYEPSKITASALRQRIEALGYVVKACG